MIQNKVRVAAVFPCVLSSFLLVVGCSDESQLRPKADAMPLDFDAAPFGCSSESERRLSSCNPVTQAGCASGEKCAELILVADDPMTEANEFLGQIACVPAGTVTEGMECTSGTPGQCTGHDNCIAGHDCFQGVCEKMCGSAPDTCHTEPPAEFGMGFHCANSIENHFNDTTGVCLAACNPTDDAIETPEGKDAVAVNRICGVGSSCGMSSVTAETTCGNTPEPSATQTQNQVPYGPGFGQYYSNGCASGFSTFLNSNVGADEGEPQCTRYCTPTETFLDQAGVLVGMPAGANGKCSTARLEQLGGRGGLDVEHQCRFIQSVYDRSAMVPASVGMCMPTESRGGTFRLENGVGTEAPTNTWGDCSLFAWGEIKAAWNAAAPQGAEAANAAFDEVCIGLPLDPSNAEAVFYQKCIGFYYGCLSLTEQDSLDTPAATTARSGGQMLRDRFDVFREASQSQLEELEL